MNTLNLSEALFHSRDHAIIMFEALKEFRDMLNSLECKLRDVEDSATIIEEALEAARKFYRADRAYVLELDSDLHVGVNTYECSEMRSDEEETCPRNISLELILVR